MKSLLFISLFLVQAMGVASTDCIVTSGIKKDFDVSGVISIQDNTVVSSSLKIGYQELSAEDIELLSLKGNQALILFIHNLGGSEEFQRTGVPGYYDIDHSQNFTKLTLECE